MKHFIKNGADFLDRKPKLKQWLWFFGLWCGGLATVLLLAAFLKQIINAI